MDSPTLDMEVTECLSERKEVWTAWQNLDGVVMRGHHRSRAYLNIFLERLLHHRFPGNNTDSRTTLQLTCSLLSA